MAGGASIVGGWKDMIFFWFFFLTLIAHELVGIIYLYFSSIRAKLMEI
jgi:hypothetical protein